MAEKTGNEKVEPAMKNLEERVAMLEGRVKMGKERMEDFTRDKPLIALGLAFLAGACFGLMTGKSTSRNRD
ncbi:MAG: hypothetical protein QG670_397 [Thermoproteota archaeon]|nr:hypothetical protein [Thermoproteota archaeon]